MKKKNHIQHILSKMKFSNGMPVCRWSLKFAEKVKKKVWKNSICFHILNRVRKSNSHNFLWVSTYPVAVGEFSTILFWNFILIFAFFLQISATRHYFRYFSNLTWDFFRQTTSKRKYVWILRSRKVVFIPQVLINKNEIVHY